MSLRKELKEAIKCKDCELYDSVKEVLRQHKIKNQKTLCYDFDLAIKNGNQKRLERGLSGFRSKKMLSHLIEIKGLTQRAIYERMRRFEVEGFSPEKEDKILTKEICSLLFIKRSSLVVKR